MVNGGGHLTHQWFGALRRSSRQARTRAPHPGGGGRPLVACAARDRASSSSSTSGCSHRGRADRLGRRALTGRAPAVRAGVPQWLPRRSDRWTRPRVRGRRRARLNSRLGVPLLIGQSAEALR